MPNKISHMVRGMSTCRSAASFLQDYVEGRLSEKTKAKFEAHMSMCPNCERYLEQYKMTIQLVKDLPSPEPPPALADMTCEFIRESLGIEEA